MAFATLLLVGGSATAGFIPGPPARDACGVLSSIDEARAMVQDDAGSGGDAGDCAALAVGVTAAGYVWADLDAGGVAGVADLDDWFEADLASLLGPGNGVVVNITADVLAYYAVILGLPPTPGLHIPLHLEVYAPDGAPAQVISSCGDGLAFLPEAGTYQLHVYRVPVGPDRVPVEAPCVAPAPFQPATEPAPAGQSYGIYLGCHPHCATTGA